MNEPRTVYTFAKNTREEVRASLGEFGGYVLASLRIWVEGADDQPRPTKKGISVRVNQLHDLRRAVDALIEAAGEDADGDGASE